MGFCIEDTRKKAVPKLKELIMKEVRHYAGGSLSHDDVTIMIAQII